MLVARHGYTDADIRVARLPPRADLGIMFAVGSKADFETTPQKLTSSVAGLTLSVVGHIASAFAPCDSKPSSAAPRPRIDGFTEADERAS